MDRRTAARRFVVTAAIAGAFVISFGSAQAADPVTIDAVNFEFLPAASSVRVGDVVRWTFSGEPHTVTSGRPGAPDGRFASGQKNPGSSFQVTFDTVGTFRFFCELHSEQMFGTIKVAAATTPKPTARPTARPTPRPSERPSPRPTVAPTEPPTPSPAPTLASAPPTAEPSPPASATASPAATASAAASVTEPTAPPAPADGSPAGAIDPAIVVVGLVGLALLVAGGLITRRSRNR